jgi:hypothetical protein
VARVPFVPIQCSVGTTLIFATSATNPTVGGIKYTFDWGDGTTDETAFMNSGVPAVVSHKWGKPGTYYIKAKSTNNKNISPGWSDANIVIVGPTDNGNLPPKLISFTPDQASPQVAGTRVRWTTDAKDPDGDVLYYKYLVKGPQTNGVWQDRSSWIPDKYWSFLTGMFKPGLYQVQVQVRDKNHAGENIYDANSIADFTIKPKQINDRPTEDRSQVINRRDISMAKQRSARDS